MTTSGTSPARTRVFNTSPAFGTLTTLTFILGFSFSKSRVISSKVLVISFFWLKYSMVTVSSADLP
ncbi:Uncharacterised protein [Streptococcus pneumoniae]|nr:Uncharacterised protein [Streptococcus pneumoniae]